jgi:methyl-accepting chemotaxis protein/methyl-accepting chemotaxis protein-1 (serine sensor receptor)
MTVGRKLILAFGSLAMILLMLCASLFYFTDAMNKSYVQAVDVSAKKLFLIGEINTARADLRASLRATILYSFAKRPDLVEANRKKTEDAADHALALLAQLQPLIGTDDGNNDVRQIASDFQLWKEKFETVYRLCNEGDPVQAEAYGTRETKSIAESTGVSISHLRDIQQKLFERDKAIDNDRAMNAKIAVFLAVLLAIAAGIVVFRIILGITSSLIKIASELSSGSEQVTSAAMQVSSSSQSLAQGASEQAASLEETSASTHEIVSMTNRNAENSKTAMDLMGLTSQRIVDGNLRLQEMHSSMEQINTSAQKISKIIKTIDEIAFQTNILALNAAVEAARAGEAGMGFSVVADEVRNLAQRCSQAAKDTAELIEESIHTSNEGSERLGKVAEAISGITEEAEKVKVLVAEVSLSSQEQSRGLQQINKAVQEMEQVTQRTAAGAEQGAAAGEELSAQSHELSALVRTLNALIQSSSSDDVVSRPVAHKTTSRSLPAKRKAAPVHIEMAAGSLEEAMSASSESERHDFVNF